MTENEIEQLNKDHQNTTAYYAKLEEKKGEIIEIAIINGDRDGNLTSEELKEKEMRREDAKNISLDFIKENKLVDNIEALEYLGEIRVDSELCYIAYKYDEDKVITLFVELLSKRVIGFKYGNEQEAIDAIEINKNYKTEDAVG